MMEGITMVKLLAIFTAATACMQLLLAYIARRRAFSVLRRSFPIVPGGSWLLGHGPQMVSTKARAWLRAQFDNLGDSFVVNIVGRPVVVSRDPQLISAVLRSSNLYPDYMERSLSTRNFDIIGPPPHKPSILSADFGDPTWKKVRKGVAPAFSMEHLRGSFHFVTEATDHLMAAIMHTGSDIPINVDRAAQRLSMDVIGQVAFGCDMRAVSRLGADEEEEDDFFNLLDAGLKEIAMRYGNPYRKYMWFLPGPRATKKKLKLLYAAVDKMVDQCQAKWAADKGGYSVAAHLMRISDPQPLSREELASNFAIFFVAGTETAGHSIAWTLYHLSQQPGALAKVEAELDAAGLLVTPSRPAPRPMDFADVASLSYLTWVIKEAMRLTPTVPLGTRRTVRDVMLGGHLIPGGTTMWTSIYGLHHNPHIWDRVDEFVPERWAAEQAEYVQGSSTKSADDDTSSTDHGFMASTSRPALRYIPFNAGNRNCIGLGLARIIQVVAIAQFVSRFHFRLADSMGGAKGVDARESWRMTSAVEGGLWMHCTPRRLQPEE